MAKMSKRSSIIAAVGGVLLGASILLFVTQMIFAELKNTAAPGTRPAAAGVPAWRADWNATNATVDQLRTFMTVCAVLLGILGIVLIGATIISSIGGGFGGSSGGSSGGRYEE